jgi:hypothetical protein
MQQKALRANNRSTVDKRYKKGKSKQGDISK